MTYLSCLCDCKSLSFYFGIDSEIWILDSNSWVAKNMNGGGMGGGGIKYELPYISWGRARWYGRESDIVKKNCFAKNIYWL